jgi:acetyltransferase-like isoleucine patch superfamily enzyme
MLYGMRIHPTARVSFKAKLDKTNPKMIIIGEYTYITFDSIILSHDFASGLHGGRFSKPTRIGDRCFIGCGAIILPGVVIGSEVIVGAGSVVTKDVPGNCIIAGNPAKIVRENIKTKPYGILVQPTDAVEKRDEEE